MGTICVFMSGKIWRGLNESRGRDREWMRNRRDRSASVLFEEEEETSWLKAEERDREKPRWTVKNKTNIHYRFVALKFPHYRRENFLDKLSLLLMREKENDETKKERKACQRELVAVLHCFLSVPAKTKDDFPELLSPCLFVGPGFFPYCFYFISRHKLILRGCPTGPFTVLVSRPGDALNLCRSIAWCD